MQTKAIINNYLCEECLESRFICIVMARKLLSIMLAIAVFAGSIGFHVIEHHCIWCGGDRVEFISMGSPAAVTESSCNGEESDCCSEEHHGDCEDCCVPAFFTLDQGLADGDSIDLSKAALTCFTFSPAVLCIFSIASVPTNSDILPVLQIPGLFNCRLSAGFFSFRC